MMTRRVVVAVLGALGMPMHLAAQAPRTLELRAAQDSAEAAHPRARQREMLARQSALRRRNLGAELLPAVSLEAHAQYQSDVVQFPSPAVVTPPHDTYDARLGFTQRVFDPTIRARAAVERAQLEHSQASVRSSLYATRAQVNDAFFGALRSQVQESELLAFITAIETQLRVATARVREGVALPGEELAVRAELLRRRQTLAEVRIQRAAALAVLGTLTGIAVDTQLVLVVPDLDAGMARARALLDTGRVDRRPEYAQFERSRDLLREQERARGAQDLPRVSAFARAGYGQPGLNPVNTDFDSYWLAGIQLQWTPWAWGASRRDREVLAVQREIVATEEAAFTDAVRQGAVQEAAVAARLEEALATDDELVAVRERITQESAARFAEAVITPAEHVEKETELLSARITRAIHRVELAQARARLLTTLGIEVR